MNLKDANSLAARGGLGALGVDEPVVMTPKAVADLLFEMLMVRAGMVIDEAVARERANNIAAALTGVSVNVNNS